MVRIRATCICEIDTYFNISFSYKFDIDKVSAVLSFCQSFPLLSTFLSVCLSSTFTLRFYLSSHSLILVWFFSLFSLLLNRSLVFLDVPILSFVPVCDSFVFFFSFFFYWISQFSFHLCLFDSAGSGHAVPGHFLFNIITEVNRTKTLEKWSRKDSCIIGERKGKILQ